MKNLNQCNMNSFILKIFKKRRRHENVNFYKSLTKSLNTNDPPLMELFDDLDDNYCEGGKLLGNQIHIGSIYMFEYNQKIPSEYGQAIKFIDKSPMVLVTQADNHIIHGINLNLCNKAMKTLILNMVSNTDEKFFEGGYVEMCNNNQPPISKSEQAFFKKQGEVQIMNEIKKKYPLVDAWSVVRTYDKSKIRKIKYIDWYIMPYIPDIQYEGISASILKSFWKQSFQTSIPNI